MSSRPSAPYHVQTLGSSPHADYAGVESTSDAMSNCNMGNTVQVTLMNLVQYSGVLVKKTPEIYTIAVKHGFPWYNVQNVTIDRSHVVKIEKLAS